MKNPAPVEKTPQPTTPSASPVTLVPKTDEHAERLKFLTERLRKVLSDDIELNGSSTALLAWVHDDLFQPK